MLEPITTIILPLEEGRASTILNSSFLNTDSQGILIAPGKDPFWKLVK